LQRDRRVDAFPYKFGLAWGDANLDGKMTRGGRAMDTMIDEFVAWIGEDDDIASGI
jgi:hypothetical protein